MTSQWKPHHCLASHQPLFPASYPFPHVFHLSLSSLYSLSRPCLCIFDFLSCYIASLEVTSKYVFNFITVGRSSIFLSFLPLLQHLSHLLSILYLPYTSTCLTTSIGKLPHLSPMYSISLWTFTQHCIDKQQQCQTKVTHKRESGFSMCQNPKLHHAISATWKTHLYPLSYVCIVIFPCQWQRDVNLLHKTCK